MKSQSNPRHPITELYTEVLVLGFFQSEILLLDIIYPFDWCSEYYLQRKQMPGFILAKSLNVVRQGWPLILSEGCVLKVREYNHHEEHPARDRHWQMHN